MDQFSCTNCGYSFDIATNTKVKKQNFSVYKCPKYSSKYNQCNHCNIRYKRIHKNDYYSIRNHINKSHAGLLYSTISTPTQLSGNDSILEETLVNDGFETETNYLVA